MPKQIHQACPTSIAVEVASLISLGSDSIVDVPGFSTDLCVISSLSLSGNVLLVVSDHPPTATSSVNQEHKR